MTTQGEYSVCQFFEDGSYDYIVHFVSVEEAAIVAHRYMESDAANAGTIRRLIITDGGDFINFEWEYGKGIVFV